MIVDDHKVVRRELRSTLEADGGFQVVGEAGTVGEALRIVADTRPDVALVDVRLPGGGGVQLIREILSRYPGTRCLVVTSFSDAETACHALMAGASGHVAKDTGPRDLVTAVRTAARGERVIRLDLVEESTSSHRTPTGASDIRQRLSAEEQDVIDLLLLGYTNGVIASELHLSEKAVRNAVSRIMRRLEVRDWEDLFALLADRPRTARERSSARGGGSSPARTRMTG